MMVFATTLTTVSLTIAFVIVFVATATFFLRRQRRNVWQSFARQNGLKYREIEGEPHVAGQIGKRRFELAISPNSSDTGPFGVEVITMSLALTTRVPNGLILASSAGILRQAQQALGEHETITGDDSFDQDVNTLLEDATSIEWLTPARRKAFQSLVRDEPADEFRLEGDQLSWTCRTAVSDGNQLNRHLTLLLSAAQEIDRVADANPES